MEKQPVPQTMIEAVRQFEDQAKAEEFFTQIRWPHGVACPRHGCGSADVVRLEKARRWYCRDCKKQSSAKVGTIFEDSAIPFTKWLPAIWLIASNRNGISSCEVARALKVTQKTAWFMLHRIRLAMRNESFEQFGGPVEADETYVGGKYHAERDHHGRAMRKGPNAGKTTVMGIVQRGGGIRAFVVPSTRKETLAAHLRSHVARGSIDYLVSKQQMHDEIGRLIYDPTTKKPMERFVQKGVDVDLALRIDRSYRAEGWNHLVLVAGDGDFAELVGDLVEREGVRLTVVGSRQSITSALMPYAGRIVEVSSLAPTITYLRSA